MGNFTRKRHEVHPEEMLDFVPGHKFKGGGFYRKECYDGLDDNSSYSEYAWAFLRRNRFYQNYIDRANEAYRKYRNPAFWGCQIGHGTYSIGVSTPKPYWEPHGEFGFSTPTPFEKTRNKGDNKHGRNDQNEEKNDPVRSIPVEWEAVHTFFSYHYRQLFNKSGPVFSSVTKPEPYEAIFCFDLRPLLGGNMAAIDIQLEIATAMLRKRVADANGNPKITSKDKSKLRRALRVTDLLSPEQAFDSDDNQAVEDQVETDYDNCHMESDSNNHIWEIDPKANRNQEVAKHLLGSDFKGDTSTEKRENAVYRFIDEAYDYIYGWEFLTWLALEAEWSDKLFSPADEAKEKQKEAVAQGKQI